MHKVNVDELFAGKQSKYALVVGVAKRAREITAEQEESGEVTDDKPVLIAIDDNATPGFIYDDMIIGFWNGSALK